MSDTSSGGTDRFSYLCFGGCGRGFESLDDMVAVAGRGYLAPRHFCGPCARSLPYSPEEAYERTDVSHTDTDQGDSDE